VTPPTPAADLWTAPPAAPAADTGWPADRVAGAAPPPAAWPAEPVAGVIPPPPTDTGWPADTLPGAAAVPPPPPAAAPAFAVSSPTPAAAPAASVSFLDDPHGLSAAALAIFPDDVERARAAFSVAGVVLDEGEVAVATAVGVVNGHNGVAVLTASRVLLVNDRAWSPDVVSIPITPALTVQGWQDEQVAQLTFESEVVARIEQVRDKPSAFEMARLVREQVASAAS
jgi:hypothetical protein